VSAVSSSAVAAVSGAAGRPAATLHGGGPGAGSQAAESASGRQRCVYCPSGMFQRGGGCLACPRGRFQLLFGQTHCSDTCPFAADSAPHLGYCRPLAGWLIKLLPPRSAYAARRAWEPVCEPGSFPALHALPPSAEVSDRAAAGALAGVHNLSAGAGGGGTGDGGPGPPQGLRCRLCPAGKYQPAHLCSYCALSSALAAAEQALDHRTALAALLARQEGAQCAGCPAGQFSGGGPGARTCRLCPRGRFSRAAAAGCVRCPAGTAAAGVGAGACAVCPAGRKVGEGGWRRVKG
jgi:hypothetical protein